MLIFGQRHLRHVLTKYVQHYNQRRPHQALNLSPPHPPAPVIDLAEQRRIRPKTDPRRTDQRVRTSRIDPQQAAGHRRYGVLSPYTIQLRAEAAAKIDDSEFKGCGTRSAVTLIGNPAPAAMLSRMINWPEHDASLAELLEMLTSPDPVVRDDQAYTVLVTGVRRGELDERLGELGDRLVAMFGHPEIQARAFAPVILAAVVHRDAEAGGLDDGTVRRWRAAFAGWWPAESDVRGWGGALGWLHAVAHGADLAGAFGASPRSSAADLAELLRVIARRFVAATGYQYAHLEEDRVARAMIRILARPELTAEDATGWLSIVDDLLATGEPGPLPTPVANTMAVLRALYVMAHRKPLPHRRWVLEGVANRLHVVCADYPSTSELSVR
jgi:hypothetical protein